MCIVCSMGRPWDHRAPSDATPAFEALEAFSAFTPTGNGASAEQGDAPGSTASTQTLTVNQSLYGAITASDSDWYRVTLEAGQTYSLRLLGMGDTPLSDAYLVLRDGSGNQISFNDDSSWSAGRTLDSRIAFTPSASGTYFIEARGFNSSNTGDYLLTVAQQDAAGMVFTADEIAWQLINNGNRFFNSPEANAFNVGSDNAISVNITALDSNGQTLALRALEMWTMVTGITFTQTAGAAEITFDDSDSGTNAYANSSYSGGFITSSTVMITTGWLSTFGTTFNSYSFETYIHEIGHALGLAHGGNYNGSANYGTDNYYVNDSVAWSIMSYMNAVGDEFSGPNTFVDADFRYMLTPAIADIIAVQYLYGVRGSTLAGNTTYGYNSNTGIAALDQAVSIGADMAMTIWDQGGTDTLDFSGSSANQTIRMFAEQFSNVLGGISNLSIARGVTIENAIGGSGNDTITGNAVANLILGGGGADTISGWTGNDILIGGTGADVIDGGGDVDRVQYTDSTSGVTVDLMSNAANAGGAAGDTLTSIENVYGSFVGDVVSGDDVANVLWGDAGNDVLNGRGGADTLYGGENDDVLLGGAGSDVLDGGNGTDRVQYTDATTGVTVDLTSNAANAGGAAGDTLTSIENVYGSFLADTISGNDAANVVWGDAGNDLLFGRGGADSLYGGANDDVLLGGTGSDLIDGGTGTDRVQYTDATTGVTVDLMSNAANAGGAAGDTLVAIENVYGSFVADTISGDDAANVVWGVNGNDVLIGRGGADTLYGGENDDVLLGGAGSDVLDGGNGTDRVQYTDATAGVTVDLLSNAANGGGAAGDTLTSIENVYGSFLADTISGNGAANVIWGDAGADTLDGRLGNDTLFGGASADRFVFSTTLDAATNVDTISDFAVSVDDVVLSQAIFAGIGATLDATEIAFAASASTTLQRIVYDQATGQLFYDADGNGGGTAVLFARLTAGTALTTGDFVMIA